VWKKKGGGAPPPPPQKIIQGAPVADYSNVAQRQAAQVSSTDEGTNPASFGSSLAGGGQSSEGM